MQGPELKEIRQTLSMSQQALADEIGLTSKFVGMMERDEAQIERRTELAVLRVRDTRAPRARLKYLSYRQVTSGQTFPSFTEQGGPYEGNQWLKPEEPRFVLDAQFEWEGQPPPEVIELVERSRRGW